MYEGGGAEIVPNTFRKQPVPADTQTGHLQYAVLSGTGALLSYGITDVSIDNKYRPSTELYCSNFTATCFGSKGSSSD